MGAALVSLTTIGSASARDYPDKPVRIIVGYAAGGADDMTARIIADKLSRRMDQQFYVDNRPGGGTVIASEALAKSKPDGYTLMLGSIVLSANPALYENLPYDTEKAFVPIALVASFPALLAVNETVPANNLKEFIAYAKSKNGQLNYSSSGIGSMNYLATELFKKQTGLNIVHVPYKGGGEATNALLGGFVQMLMVTAAPIVGYRNKIKILAVSSGTRLEVLPNVPTFAEAGMPAFKAEDWNGILAPAGTDRQVVEKLNRELNAVVDLPDVRKRFEKLGAKTLGGTPEQFAILLNEQIATWEKVLPPEARIKR